MQLPDGVIALILLWVSPTIVSAAVEPRPALPWPHNLPKHVKYFPEDEVHVKRGLSIQDRLKKEKPIGIKKMSEDEGEMFFLDNWIFAGDEGTRESNEKREEYLNLSMPALSPLRPIYEQGMLDSMRRFAARSSLMGRDFKCPEGTNDCSSIGAPNSCCGTTDTCITIQNTGFGSVGCCPRGRTCAGAISCDTKNGYSSCPDSSNGGCCLPGYSCRDVGCVAAGTSVTWVQPPTSTPRPSSTAVIVVPTTPSPTPTPTPTSNPTPSSSYTCSSGWFSCAANLGGGCCQNGRECATGASCIDLSSTARSTDASPSAPIRPTPESSLTSGTDPGATICPTGFYVCSAYYPGGCCRVGRDCQTTGSCAPTASTTVVGTNGVVIVAPTGASLAPQRGTCATGWYSCAASVGGNCCPNGYGCGQQQCTATASGNTQVADKVAPNSHASPFSTISILGLAITAISIGIAMVIL
ncbi:hypothetical protein B0J11DRAFT_299825 [Dendryphion nanum]|uniref:GPI anchored protein n=1 Tax=Dendryphion nanum TaxID=256645 RepID=A0A9P9DTW4_9PLEO|nr:hypothetical protein B0J11DRAFT_299825 [Dendryphion nanum]